MNIVATQKSKSKARGSNASLTDRVADEVVEVPFCLQQATCPSWSNFETIRSKGVPISLCDDVYSTYSFIPKPWANAKSGTAARRAKLANGIRTSDGSKPTYATTSSA
jgi:hypothetical protein